MIIIGTVLSKTFYHAENKGYKNECLRYTMGEAVFAYPVKYHFKYREIFDIKKSSLK